MTSDETPLTYKSSGVDLDQYGQAMQRLPELLRRTQTPRVMPLSQGFAGLFRLDASRYNDPVLVTGADGVGTKLKVAQLAGRFDTLGIDLVAMSVNDCLCLGAEPLFFLDYLAMGRDNPELVVELVEGVARGCAECGAALLGGETAVMPDVYADADFDMAGFCVGVAEREAIIDGGRIRPGDVVLGLPSSGFHSNGYSLIRKVVFEVAGLSVETVVPELGRSVADELLEPTRLYARPVAGVLGDPQTGSAIHGIAHITGGGLAENVARILPEGAHVELRRDAWQIPACFTWLENLGKIDPAEMFRVFNMGIGMVLIVAAEAEEGVKRRLLEHDQTCLRIGRVTSGARNVEFVS